MSQIFAVLHLDGSRVQPSELESAAGAQKLATHTTATPRLWRDAEGADNIGLLHLRQTITAEDHLDRPWNSADTFDNGTSSINTASLPDNVIVADSRLDNRAALARQLHLPAAELHHLPDCAIILSAYQRWGERCLQYLLGDFAFIIWNQTQQRLFCARSAVGNRSLYWFKNRTRLVIASTTSTLFALPGVDRNLDPAALARQLSLAGNIGDTLYQGIHRLPCAHSLSCSESKAVVERYWTPDLSPLRLPSDEQYLELFDEIFSEAVQCRLRTEADVGILMSGGLDSTAVAATAAPLLDADGKRLTAFSSLPGNDLDQPAHGSAALCEQPLIDAVASRYPNIDLQVINDYAIGPFDAIERSFEYSGSASVATANRSWLEKGISQAAEHGINVMLTGAMGNGTVSYNGHTRLTALLHQGRWRTLIRELRAFAATQGTSVLRVAINHLLTPMLSPSSMNGLMRLGISKRRPWTDFSPVSSQAIRTLIQRPNHLTAKWNRRHGSAEWRAAIFFSGVMEDANSDESATRHHTGVDTRDPTADKRLIEFCLSLPEDQYLRNGQDRSLIRRAMQGRLPAAVLEQTIRGGQAQDWHLKMAPLREEFRQELRRMQHSETAREILDLPRLQALIENWPTDNWHDDDAVVSYKNALLHGIAAGRFIRWVESNES